MDRKKQSSASFSSEFVCKLKFRNDLPHPQIEPKLIKIPIDLSKYSAFRTFSNEQSLVNDNLAYSKVDIFTTCPSDLIYHSIGEIADVKRQQEQLDQVDEQLCTDGIRQPASNLQLKQQNLGQTATNGTNLHSLGISTNIPGSDGFEIESENDLINAIAESFEPCQEFQHPTNPSLTVSKIFDLLPNKEAESFVQCNFDSSLRTGAAATADKDGLILRQEVGENERFFDAFSRITDGKDEFKFIKEYNYHGYSEEGNTLVLSLVSERNVAFYSFVNTKLNLRKKRGALIDGRDKAGDTLIIERK